MIDGIDESGRWQTPHLQVLCYDAEGAYAILDAIAEIIGYSHHLKKRKATANEKASEALAHEISVQHPERQAPFAFSMCNIGIGEQIEFCSPGNAHDGALCS